jgi:peptidoglycan/xylan/chitin deacetylase (PgdA/CDA1 family)
MKLVLCYHHITDVNSKYSNIGPTETKINSQIKMLELIGKFVPLDCQQNEGLQFSVTFDDGYQNNFSTIRNLAEKGYPVTIFIATANIEKALYYYWDALDLIKSGVNSILSSYYSSLCKEFNVEHDKLTASISALGADQREAISIELTKNINQSRSEKLDEWRRQMRPMTLKEAVVLSQCRNVKIGAHSDTHGSLARMNLAEAQKDLENSVSKIESWTGFKVTDFAFPFGTESDVTENLFSPLARIGVERAWTTKAKFIEKSDSTFALPRQVMFPWSNFELSMQIGKTFLRTKKGVK